MKVVFLVWRDTGHPDGGGSEVFVERIGTELAGWGHDVTIVCADHGAAPRDEVRNGVRFRRRGGRLGVYLHGLRYLRGEGRRADVVVDVQNGIPFLSPLARRHGIVVLVHHVHREQWQIIYPGWRGRIGWWIESRLSPRLYRRFRYVTVSEASRRDMTRLGIATERIDIVHNGIDVVAADRLAPRSQHPTLCVLGRLVPHKQVEHALVVVARLREDIPDLRLEIVGEGWWHEPLVAEIARLGLQDIVTLHGRLDDAARDAVLDRSWLLLAPSVKEGWGIAIMEAAARGVPAVAYRSGGGVCESILDRETGRLVEDLDELTKVVAEILDDRTLRLDLARAAAARAGRYDWSSSARSFEDALVRAAPGRAVSGAADGSTPTGATAQWLP